MSQEQNISVFVRSRPLNTHERRSVVDMVLSKREVKVQSNSSTSFKDPKSFRFDQVFGPESRQNEVYDKVVSPLIEQVLQGFNCTVFAYGQTGTGKTYTMEGKRSDPEVQWEEDPNLGIVPRAISQLFDTLNRNKHEFTIRVSFLELYNEDAYNLLSSVDDTTKLKIFDDAKNKGSVIFGGGLSEVIVTSKAEIYDILRRGSEKRQTAATLMNACSSRSHTIFSVTVHIREGSIDGEDILKTGKLNLVDLAGSENIGRSGALDKRAREAGNINQSLLTLGRVITALVEKRPHVPYRESKLTRLLQDSLGGKTKTSIIATISPALADLEDTLSTLDYASRAKKIMNRPEKNQRLTRKAEALELRREVERLQRDLKAAWEKNGITLDEENYNEMRKQASAAHDMNERMSALLEEIDKNKKLFQDFKSNYETTKAKLDEAEEESRRKAEIFQRKEEQLLSHANKLAAVAKNAAQDAYLLQTKKERIENALKENRAHLDKYQDSFDARLSRIENVIDSINADAKHEAMDIQKFAERIGMDIQKFAERIENITTLAMTVKREFTSLRSETEHVLNRDIKDDTRTGQTPQKRTYDIPDRIFKSDLNDSILEDPEIEKGSCENSNGA